MAKYAYTIRDTDGHVVSGVRFGDSADDVADFFEQKNFTIVSLDELNFDGSC